MKVVKGNIFDLAEQGEFDVVVHGCNCFCTMGKGIAKEVKTRYPWVYEADLKTHKGDSDKLGTSSEAGVITKTGEFIIVNAYTQFHYWGDNGIHDTRDNSPSLDRLVPELGYIKSNVRVISQRANRIKHNATLEELKALYFWLEKELMK